MPVLRPLLRAAVAAKAEAAAAQAVMVLAFRLSFYHRKHEGRKDRR